MKRVLVAWIPGLLLACTEGASPPTTPAPLAAVSGGKPKLSVFKARASIGWSSAGGSSPGDGSNDVSLQIVTCPQSPSAAGAFTFGRDEEANSIVGRALGQIDHLGFDSRGYLGAGSPRITLTTAGNDGNHTYFLSAFHCNPGAPQSSWVTSNFLSPSCAVFRDSEISGFAGLGAAAAVADANGERVTDWFLIQEEGPATVFIDRLTVQDWMWVRGGGPGIRSCLDVNPTCI